MTPSVISVSNSSKHATDEVIARKTAACAKQLAFDVTPFYGKCPAVEFVPKGAKATAGSCPATVSDKSDTPGAAGYHDEGADGIPYIKVFALGSDDDTGVTMSHEFMELSQDASANIWADGPGGQDYAYELGDPVEGDTYPVDGELVSNFVLPAWFDPQAKTGERFDFLGKLKAPFTMTAGGYMIVRAEKGAIQQVFAHHSNQHIGADVRAVEAGIGLYVVFGSEFPEHKKAEKIAKALRRRGGV